jgi:hypothetical protein
LIAGTFRISLQSTLGVMCHIRSQALARRLLGISSDLAFPASMRLSACTDAPNPVAFHHTRVCVFGCAE